MMTARIIQIMPAPGWKALIGKPVGNIKDGNAEAVEVPVVGWAVADFINDDRDVKDLGFPKSYRTVDLVVLYNNEPELRRLLRVSLDVPLTVFEPGRDITEEDKLDLVQESCDSFRIVEEKRKEIIELHRKGNDVSTIVRKTDTPRDEVMNYIRFANNKSTHEVSEAA
jgi:hypothetical protein